MRMTTTGRLAIRQSGHSEVLRGSENWPCTVAEVRGEDTVGGVLLRVLRTILRVAVVAVLVVAAAGCWPAPGAGPDRRSHNPFEGVIGVDSVATLAEVWTARLPEAGVSDPVVSGAGVHVRTEEALYGVDRSTGTVRWRAPVPVAGRVYAGDVVVVGDRLLASYGWWSDSWEPHWFDVWTGADEGSTPGAQVSAVRGGDALYASATVVSSGLGVTGLSVLTIDGRPGSWGGLLDLPGATAAVPALTLGREHVYHAGWALEGDAGTRSLGVRAFPARGGRSDCGPPVFPEFACPVWSTPVDDIAGIEPVLSEDGATLFVATTSGVVHALDTATGAVRWSASVGAAVTAPPALADGVLFVPTDDGDLAALDAGGCGSSTCSVLWTAATGSQIGVQPAVVGGVVFTGSADGSLNALAAAGCGEPTCGPLWSVDVGSRINGAPAVTGGRLYVGTNDGRLVAYAPQLGSGG